MKILYKYLLFICLAFMACNTQNDHQTNAMSPSDSKASEGTVKFYTDLNKRMKEGIMLGHQDALAYGNKWYGEPGRSDVKSVCGDYPAVFGWDLGKIETGSDFNIDSIAFNDLRKFIVDVNKLGGVSSLSWHVNNPVTNGNYDDCSADNVVKSILPGNTYYNNYTQYLDKLADFLNTLKDEEGKFIPVVFRPFHDHNLPEKNWWNTEQCTTDDFKKLWIATVDYLQNEKDIHHILYAYSVYGNMNISNLNDYYPGNKYVDIVGVNLHLLQENDPDGTEYIQTLNHSLAVISQFAEKNNKIAALTDTGLEGIKISNYFSKYVYPIISQYKLSYVLFWRNAWDDEKHYYIPIPGHPASDDFVQFAQNTNILTCKKL